MDIVLGKDGVIFNFAAKVGKLFPKGTTFHVDVDNPKVVTVDDEQLTLSDSAVVSCIGHVVGLGTAMGKGIVTFPDGHVETLSAQLNVTQGEDGNLFLDSVAWWRANP